MSMCQFRKTSEHTETTQYDGFFIMCHTILCFTSLFSMIIGLTNSITRDSFENHKLHSIIRFRTLPHQSVTFHSQTHTLRIRYIYIQFVIKLYLYITISFSSLNVETLEMSLGIWCVETNGAKTKSYTTAETLDL